MKNKIAWSILSCLMVAALLMASCGPATVEEEGKTVTGKVVEKEEAVTEEGEVEAPTVEGPQYGGSLKVIGMYPHYEPTSWDHGDVTWTTGIWTGPYQETLLIGDVSRGPGGTEEFVFNQTVGVPDDSVVGQLAESWELPDPLTIVFKIRQGVYWQGKPGVMASRELVASDVAFCFNRIMASPKMEKTLAFLDSVTAQDKFTVVFRLNNYIANWRRTIGYHQNMFIYPPELVEAGAHDFRNAVGTGPFMLKDYVDGSSLTYVRNPNYWGTTTISGKEYQLPFVDELVHLLIVDESTKLAAIRTAKCDIHEIGSFRYKETLAQSNPEIKVVRNLSDTPLMVGMRMDRSPFEDIRVRRALSMAIDRQSVIRTIFDGEAEIQSFPYTATWPETLYTPMEKMPKSVQEQFEYNPERARQLLTEAGYPDGFETEVLLRTFDQDLASLLVAYWKDVGVDCAIKTQDPSTFIGTLYAEGHEQMALQAKATGDAFEPLRLAVIPGGYNSSIVTDPRMLQLHDEAMGTSDETLQRSLCKEMVIYFHEQSFYIILPTGYTYIYYWPWVKNYNGEISLGAANRTAPVFAQSWIDTALKAELME